LVGKAKATHLTIFDAGRTFGTFAAQIAFKRFFSFGIEIDPFGFKWTSFDAKFTAIAKLLIDIDDALFVNTHRLILFRTFVIAGMIFTLLAGVDFVHHHDGISVQKYPVKRRTCFSFMNQRANSLTGSTASAKRNIRGVLYDMYAFFSFHFSRV